MLLSGPGGCSKNTCFWNIVLNQGFWAGFTRYQPPPVFLGRGKTHDLRLYPHLPRRRRRPGRHEPETQVQTLADAGVEPAHIVSDVGVSGSVPAGDRPGWTGLDVRLLRGDTLTVAALDRISRNRVELVAVVESLHRRGVGIASLAPAESWLHPLGAHPTEVERMMGEIILRVMAWAAQAELDSIKRRIAAGVRRAAEEGRFPGRPKALTPDQTAAIRLLRRNGQSQSAVARTFGVSRQTIWRAEQTE